MTPHQQPTPSNISPLAPSTKHLAPPLRLAFIMHVMQIAGAEILVERIIKTLGDRIKPTIICLDAIGELGEQLIDEGIDVVCLDRKPGKDWKLPRRLARVLKERDIQIAHAHQYTPYFYTALAKALGRRSLKLMITEHGRHFPDVVSFKRRAINRLFLGRLANRANACSRFSGDALRDLDGFRTTPVEVIYNGVDIDHFHPVGDRTELRASLELKPNRKYVAMVARFHPIKDHQMLIHAFDKVAKQNASTDLILVGDGEDREKMEQLVSELGLQDRIHFWGVRSDIKQILQAIDCFTLSSISEAASLTLLEAMACGCPIVTTNVGGNPELARHEKEALLVPRGDSAAMAKALQQVVEDDQLATKLAKAARNRVVEKFDWRDNVKAFERIYNELGARC